MEQLSHIQTLTLGTTSQFCRAQLKLKVCLLAFAYLKTFSAVRDLRSVHFFLFPVAGVDKDAIVAVLVKRNNEQRQKIKVVYEDRVGKVRKRFIVLGALESSTVTTAALAPLCSAEIGHSSEVMSQVGLGGRRAGPVDASGSF